MALSQKDVLGLRTMPTQDIREILHTAELMSVILASGNKKTPHLQGKSILTIFYENSTRTRLSFELAAKYMSGNAANMTASSSSVAKGESLIDTGRTLDRMATDVMIIRHPLAGAPQLLAQNVRASVINAGDGMHEHPTQALLDAFTIQQKRGKLEGLKVAIVGDILHSRVARSNLWGLTKLGAQVILAGPPTLLPPEFAQAGAQITDCVDDAVREADVVMGLRIQRERMQQGLLASVREYHAEYGLTPARIALARKDALVMHPGPVNRGVEIASSVADGLQSVIDEQVTHGVAVRMALLFLLTRRTQL